MSNSSDDIPLIPGKNIFTHWILLILSMIFVLLTPALIKGPYHKEPFFDDPIREIIKENPEFVFVGNSLVATRMDEQKLEQLTGKKVYLLKEGGTYSAIWYLKFKNYLVASGVKPKAVFFFFRMEELIIPDRNIDRKFLASIQKVSHDDEPVMDYVLNSNRTLKNRIEEYATNFYSIRVITPVLLDLMESIALTPIFKDDIRFILNRHFKTNPNLMTDNEKQRYVTNRNLFVSQVNFTFSFESKNLRKRTPSNLNETEKEPIRLEFSDDPHKSFVPHIVQLAKENDIPLVFIKIQTIPPADGNFHISKSNMKYLEDFEKYLADNNVFFYDLTGDPEITRDMYDDNVHIGANDREKYTEIFYRRLSNIFK